MNITNSAGETPKDVARRFAQLAVIKVCVYPRHAEFFLDNISGFSARLQ